MPSEVINIKSNTGLVELCGFTETKAKPSQTHTLSPYPSQNFNGGSPAKHKLLGDNTGK